MSYKQTIQEINGYRGEMMALRKKMRDLQSRIEPEQVSDYSFSTTAGKEKLSDFFGDKDTLFVIHNMGKSCPSCTQWADGFNGALDHLKDRAAFVVTSPDAPEVQQAFASGRGWRFKMASHIDTNFAMDMGYRGENGFWPGVSVFKRDGARMLRVSDTTFGPGDSFNVVYNFLDLIPEGANGWEPQFSYEKAH